MKQKHINIVAGIVLAFDFFVMGINTALGEWITAVGMLIMSVILFLCIYQGNKATKALEETKRIDDILPYAAALAVVARHLKDESEQGKKEDVPSCSAENNDQIAFGNNSNLGDKK